MKMRNGIIILMLMMTVGSCTKKNVDTVNFNVTSDSNIYHISYHGIDTGTGAVVRFAFSGNPDYIVFYSGENGHQYQNRKRTSAIGGIPILRFLSLEQYSRDTSTQSLRLLLSGDFNGSYDSASVLNANWTDITPTLSTGQKNPIPSGNIDLSSFVNQDTTTYLAFKFSDTSDGHHHQRNWTITNFLLQDSLPDGSSTNLLDISSNSTWMNVNVSGGPAYWIINNSYLKIAGGDSTIKFNQQFVISQPVNLSGVNPDSGLPIKTLTDNPLSVYSYLFTKPGTYTVTFNAKNANAYSGSEILKTLTLTIQ